MNTIKNIWYFVLFLSATIFSQTQSNHIAVLNLDAIGVTLNESITMSDRLRSELVSVGFSVVERSEMSTILEEQGFQNSGCTSDECAVEIGKLLNISKIVAGSIGKVGSLYSVSVRMIDVESGKITRTVTDDCRCPIETLLQVTMRKVALLLTGKFVKKQDKNTVGSALFRSMVLPGWGQAYQGKEITKYLYPGLFIASVAGTYFALDSYNTAVDDYNKSRTLYSSAFLESEIERYGKQMNDNFDKVESSEQLRNIMFISVGAVWLWNVLDTIVFPEEGNITSKYSMSTVVNKQNIMAGVNINF